MNNVFKKYILFWFSQAFSQLGSSMTAFALILWAFTQKNTAMTVSLMTFFNYLPTIIFSLFAGSLVDRCSKKKILLTTDSIAAICTAVMLGLSISGGLKIRHIYLVNLALGLTGAFQGPASLVVLGKMVPKEKLEQVSGMHSFSDNLIIVFSPVLAASLFAWGGLKLVLIMDLMSFLFAFLILFLVIEIPKDVPQTADKKSVLSGCSEGFRYLKEHHGVFLVIITMAVLNFFSRLTYENILSPMILLRSANNSVTLGMVNAAIGIGGIAGGIFVSLGIIKASHAKMIYISAMLSFLLGDLLMGLGRSTIVWSFAGLAASFPIPLINAGQLAILYSHVPEEILGRVFAVRNAIQFSAIPFGILFGGLLADYVFEPFMLMQNPIVWGLQRLVGEGAGSGMAVMFLCTGIAGTLFSFIFYRRKEIRDL